VRGDPERQGLQAPLLDQPVVVGHRRVNDVLAQVVARACRPAAVTNTGSSGPVVTLAA